MAYALLISDEAVRQHIDDFREKHKLKPENGGSDSKLDAQQAELFSDQRLNVQEFLTYVFVCN